MTQNRPHNTHASRIRGSARSYRTISLINFAVLLVASRMTLAAPPATATFTPIGFLPGDDTSSVSALDNDATVAACVSYYRDPVTRKRVYTAPARWTPTDGMQPLPLLSDTSNGQDNPFDVSIAGRDVTNDGSKILFTSYTTTDKLLAVGIADPDGSNLINITALPNGDQMTRAKQLSDDGTTAFGFRMGGVSGFASIGSVWTPAGGVQALVPPAGFAETDPSFGAISSDGSVSAGVLSNTTSDGAYLEEQAYRWTRARGVQGLGYLSGGERSSADAITSDGTMILGASATAIAPIDIAYGDIFVWTEADGMLDMGRPYIYQQLVYGIGVSGVSDDGSVATAGGGQLPYIMNVAAKYFFNFNDLLVAAGLADETDGWNDFILAGITQDGNTVYGAATDPTFHQQGFIVRFPANYLRNLVVPPRPAITSALEATATVDQPFSYQIVATADPLSYSSSQLPAGLDFDYDTGMITGRPSVAGDFEIKILAFSLYGFDTKTLILRIDPAVVMPPVARLLNISTRVRVLTGDNVLIGGFIITGDSPKKVILRGIGPSLAGFGVADPLLDPVLELHLPDGTIVSNDDWKDSQQSEIEATGLAPSDDHEAAISVTLTPGSYTAIVSGKNGGVGVGLVEAYDLDQPAESKLANISTRGFIDSGDKVLIGGVIVGSADGNVIIRAIGPSLKAAGVAGALQDPILELHNPDGSILASDDNWQDTQASDIEASGFAPNDFREATIIVTLAPNNYTAIVSGKDGSSGVGLVEVYNVD